MNSLASALTLRKRVAPQPDEPGMSFRQELGSDYTILQSLTVNDLYIVGFRQQLADIHIPKFTWRRVNEEL